MISALSYFNLGRLMRQFQSYVLVNHAFGLHELCDMANRPRFIVLNPQPGQAVQVPDPSQETVPDEIRASIKTIVEAIEAEAKKVQLRNSFEVIQSIQQSLEQSYYPISGLAADAAALHGGLVTDLRYTTCFALWGAEEELYTKPDRFGEAVTARFPEAAYDIEEAAKCLALNRGTACVLHLLRVLEIALQELGRDLHLSKIDKNWENLLNDVDAAVRALPFKTETEKEYRGHRAGAAAHLRNVKNAWRNKSVHPGNKYTPEEAEGVWTHAKALMQSLAAFL